MRPFCKSSRSTSTVEKQFQSSGIPIENLRPLFEAAEQNFPKENFESAVETAIDSLLAKSANPVAVLNDPIEIRNAIAFARQKLELADVDGAVFCFVLTPVRRMTNHCRVFEWRHKQQQPNHLLRGVSCVQRQQK